MQEGRSIVVDNEMFELLLSALDSKGQEIKRRIATIQQFKEALPKVVTSQELTDFTLKLYNEEIERCEKALRELDEKKDTLCAQYTSPMRHDVTYK